MALKFSAIRTLCCTAMGAVLVVGMVPQAASAQEDERLGRIESQLRALQRAVFPGGDQRFFEPEITATPAQPQQQGSSPEVSASALTGVLARIDAIEQQLARLTAATEVNENALATLTARLDAVEQARTAPVSATPASTTQTPGSPTGPTGVIPVPGETPTRVATQTSTPAQGGTQAAAPSSERLAGVQAIAKPATDDAGDDEYVYGFRLWEAGYYAEAQQQLALFLERYPTHSRTSWGRNLLGRAYLDAGEPRRAATYFFENYQADKQAARAPDSLLYLAQSMIELGDTRRACIALAEFGDTYPALATGRLQNLYDSNRGRVDCQ